jgi:hypothetical protein
VGLRVQPFVGGLIGGEEFFFLLERIIDSLSFYFLSVVSKFQLLGR